MVNTWSWSYRGFQEYEMDNRHESNHSDDKTKKIYNLLRWWWDENMTIKREIILLPLFFGIGLSLLMILFWWMVHIQASSHYFPFALILKPQKRVFIYSRIVNLFMNKERLSGFSLRPYKQNLQSCRCWTKLKINSVFRRVHRAFN